MSWAGAYLFAWLFVLGLSLGATALLMVHGLTGGRWGEQLYAPLAAAARLLPLVALLFVPLVFAVDSLYPWANGHSHAPWWLSRWFFVGRSFAYLILWSALGYAWLAAAPAARARIGAGGLVLYSISITLAAVDWIGSLTPEWYSTGFGLVVGLGQMLGAAAFAVMLAALAGPREAPERYIDLGNLLLVFVLTWAYLAFMQYVVIWSGNLPREISWYLPRLRTSWRAIAVFLVVAHFFVPFAILLFRAVKRRPRLLGALAALLLAAHAVDTYWLVAPSISPAGLVVGWRAGVAFVALAGIWFGTWRLVHG